MPVPSSINELSTNPAANSPDGTSEGPGTLDNYQRAHAAFIAQLRDYKADQSAAVMLSGDQTIHGTKTFSSPIGGSVTGTAANVTGTVAIANGGTGQTTAAAAFTALKQAATTSGTGVVELATGAETQAGTDTARAVTPANLAASMLGGVGQSLQNLIGSRALSTNYTNTTGRPIFVHVRCTTTAGSGTGNFLQLFAGAESVGGVIAPGAGAGYGSSASLVILPGVSYSAAMSNATLVEWKEIR